MAGGLLAKLFVAGGLAFVAWQIVLETGSKSAALVRLAQEQIETGGDVDWRHVRRLASSALEASPLETRALVLLAAAAEAEHDDRRSAGLISLAGARTLRDAPAQLWLFELRLKEDDFPAALDHADVLLRVHPRLKPKLLPYLMAVAAAPSGKAATIEMLEGAPPWRNWFLKEFSRQAADPSDPTPLYAALQSGPRPPRNAELHPHLQRLIAAERFEQALLLWLGSLSESQAADLDYLYNGSFVHPVSNLAFDWEFGRVRGAEIGIAASPMGGGKALRVQFGRGRVPFKHVRKLLVLAPGSYELSGRAMAVEFGHERGLGWTLACAEGGRVALASTARISGTARVDIAVAFSVPAEGCRAQWLKLELAARIPPEQEVDGGTVWFDSLRFRRNGEVSPGLTSRAQQ